MSDVGTFGYGQMGPFDWTSDVNKIVFAIEQALGRVRTVVLVQIKSVTNSGDLSPVGFCSAQPLVSMVDGNGNVFPHGVVANLAYFRLQGGSNAIIMDPQVGDIGIAVICDRDISGVKTNKAPSAPGSFRQFDLADGILLGGCLNGTPSQYVQFNDQGITIADVNGNKIVMSNSGVAITGDITVTGKITASKDIVAGSISLENHIHPGVQSGSSDTGPPTG